MMLDSVFNIINFLIFISVCSYLFYRFARPIIVASIQEEIKETNDLGETQNSLENLQKESEQQFIEDKQFYAYMLKKIGRWRVTSTERKVFSRAQEQEQELLARSKAQKKAEYLAFYKIQQKVVPAALKLAEKDLINYFSTEQAQRSYIDTLLQNIKSS